jgi:hypothetical protein
MHDKEWTAICGPEVWAVLLAVWICLLGGISIEAQSPPIG